MNGKHRGRRIWKARETAQVIRSTPTLVINGKFAANGPSIRTLDEMLAVTKELAQREYWKK